MAPSLSGWVTHVTGAPDYDNLLIYCHVTLARNHDARETSGRKKRGIRQRFFIASRTSYLLSTSPLESAMAPHRAHVRRNLNDIFKHMKAGESIPASAPHSSYTGLSRFQCTTTVMPSSAIMVHSANQYRLPPPGPSIEEAPSSTTSTGKPLFSRNTPNTDVCGKRLMIGRHFQMPLQWHHNEHNGVSDHQPHDCLPNRLFRRRSKKHQSSASLAFVQGIHRWPVNSQHKGPVTRKIFPFDDVIMCIVIKESILVLFKLHRMLYQGVWLTIQVIIGSSNGFAPYMWHAST